MGVTASTNSAKASRSGCGVRSPLAKGISVGMLNIESYSAGRVAAKFRYASATARIAAAVAGAASRAWRNPAPSSAKPSMATARTMASLFLKWL
jgi:hypothetical protein